jgi:hypothetical protein
VFEFSPAGLHRLEAVQMQCHDRVPISQAFGRAASLACPLPRTLARIEHPD